uniref:Uncharacterized protein n=1 Tax=Kalanchoe fedtschenkoi TaxID=63787 RepID=A0A7N0UET0_KALFE
MEAVGARLGRSSTRYGPTTVFTGPVRRWKKKWVHVAPPSSASNGSSSRDRDGTQSSQSANGSNSNNGSHVMLYKWTPISLTENSGAIGDTTPVKEDGVEELPRRKLKFIPIALLDEQKNETIEQAKEDTKAIEVDLSTGERASKSNIADEKPDMNDTPMRESETLTVIEKNAKI